MSPFVLCDWICPYVIDTHLGRDDFWRPPTERNRIGSDVNEGNAMNRSQRILPVYTGDVSGACSALFELGGMVVIHDPSGCNSTYNTHDETRWYDHNSMIFISALMERDAILGNDNKLVDDVVDAALELKPRFIAICNSPIPFISGTDFPALCKIIERRTNIPCLYVRTNGMHDYTVGAGRALAEVAHRFVLPTKPREQVANILGATPLDFCEPGAVDRLRAFVGDAGFELLSCWAMGSTLDELMRSGEAAVNLVVSSVGIPVARLLRERFGTPYVVGVPIDGFAVHLADALTRAAKTGECLLPARDARMQGEATCYVVGEPVAATSRAAALEIAAGEPVRAVCAVESAFDLLGPIDVRADGEEEVEQALTNASTVYADKLYAPVCPASARLMPLPHLAFSGRQALAR